VAGRIYPQSLTWRKKDREKGIYSALLTFLSFQLSLSMSQTQWCVCVGHTGHSVGVHPNWGEVLPKRVGGLEKKKKEKRGESGGGGGGGGGGG